MSEAVEYRVKMNRAYMELVMAIVLNLGAMLLFFLTVFVGEGPDVIAAYAFMLFYIVGNFLSLWKYKATCQAGKFRELYAKAFSEFSDPPLEKWEKSLEERDEFEVNYEQ